MLNYIEENEVKFRPCRFFACTCHWHCVSVNNCRTSWHVLVLRKIPVVSLFTYRQAHGYSILRISKLDSAALQGLSSLSLDRLFYKCLWISLSDVLNISCIWVREYIFVLKLNNVLNQQCCSFFFKNKLLYIPVYLHTDVKQWICTYLFC